MIGPNGSLLGIGSLMMQQTSGASAIDGNMVVPINLLKPIFDQLSTLGRVESRHARGLDFSVRKFRIRWWSRLQREWSADEADIKVGDIVVAVDDARVKSLAGFSGMSGLLVMPG